MFLAFRGSVVSINVLDPDIEQAGKLLRTALEEIGKMLSTENQRYKRDVCCRFTADRCPVVSGSDDRSAAV